MFSCLYQTYRKYIATNEAFPPQLLLSIVVIILPLSVLKTKHIHFIYILIIFTSLKAKRRILFPCALTGDSSSAFLPQKLSQLILLCTWVWVWHCKLHFLSYFTPKLIVNTPHQLLICPCLHLELQRDSHHPFPHRIFLRCTNKRLWVIWILSWLGFTQVQGVLKITGIYKPNEYC